jgi:hypothetical protein
MILEQTIWAAMLKKGLIGIIPARTLILRATAIRESLVSTVKIVIFRFMGFKSRIGRYGES